MNYLVIEGNIGAGKTSLVEKLSSDLGAKAIYEQFADNPFLPKFYNNPDRYSFPLELSFLADRYKQHKEELSDRDIFTPLSIADYYFSKSLIFAGITLAEDEYRLYRQLFNIILQNLPKPDLYVYLHASVDQLIDNIKKRGREYEKTISPDYLLKVQKAYFNYFRTAGELKIVIIDVRNMNFIEDKKDYNSIKNYIFERDYDYGITRISEG